MHDHANCLNAHALQMASNGQICASCKTCTNQAEEEKLFESENGSTDNYDSESDVDNQ